MLSITERVKKAKGFVIPTSLIIAAVVGIYGKQILGWPLTVDNELDALGDNQATITKDMESLKETDVEQKKINEKMTQKQEEMITAQHTMNVEQAKQGVTLENIGETLKRIERNGR